MVPVVGGEKGKRRCTPMTQMHADGACGPRRIGSARGIGVHLRHLLLICVETLLAFWRLPLVRYQSLRNGGARRRFVWRLGRLILIILV